MSDAVPAVPLGGVAEAAGLSGGGMLRAAREKAGLHIGALAVSLKVPVNKLEALEADRIDLLPDAVFARALAASVCRTLKLDPGPVLRKLPDQMAPRLQLDAKVSAASFDVPGMGWRVPLLSRLPKPVVVAVSVLLLAALAVLFVPSLDWLGWPPAPEAPAKRATPTATAAPAIPLAAQASSAAVAVVSVPAADAALPVAVSPGLGVQVPDNALVVFKMRGPSWLEVTDATGAVSLRKNLVGGETVSAQGALPLSVVVGRADATDVLVRGKPFDLTPFARDNVARFQIK